MSNTTTAPGRTPIRTSAARPRAIGAIGRALTALLVMVASLAAMAGTAQADTIGISTGGGKLTVETGDGDNTVILSTPTRGHVKVVVHRASGNDYEHLARNISSVTVKLNGGNDTLLMPGVINIQGDLKLELGAGSDRVRFGQDQPSYTVANVTGRLTVDGGSGNDEISITQTIVGGLTSVNVGTGVNNFASNTTTFEKNVTVRQSGTGRLRFNANGGNHYNGRLTVTGGNASDSASIRNSLFNDDVVLNTRGANDALNFIGNTFKDRLTVNLGSGADVFESDAGSYQSTTRIVAGSGNDHLDLDGTNLWGAMNVNAGPGNDVTFLARSTAHRNFTWQGASGNDVISLGGVTFNAAVTLDGGGNTDTLGGEVVTFNGPAPRIRNIENQ